MTSPTQPFTPLPPPPRHVLQPHSTLAQTESLILTVLIAATIFMMLITGSVFFAGTVPGDPTVISFINAFLISLVSTICLAVIALQRARRTRKRHWLCRSGLAVEGHILSKHRSILPPFHRICYRFVHPHTNQPVEHVDQAPRTLWRALSPGDRLNILVHPAAREGDDSCAYELSTLIAEPITRTTPDFRSERTTVVPYNATPPLPPYLPRIAGFAFIPMLIVTFIPVYTVWSVNHWEAVGSRGIFWTSLYRFPFGHPELMNRLLWNYLVIFSISAALGATCGALSVLSQRLQIRQNQNAE